MNNGLILVLLFGFRFGSSIGDEDERDQYENDKRFLFETTTSHFADRNLAAMEAAIKDLGTRVQQLETENQLEESLVYRLNRELITVQSELNATMYRQGKLTSEIKDFSLNVGKIRLVDAYGQINSVRGRLEIFYNNSWGTVCDDGFGSEEARVTCHMLGWENPSVNYLGSAYYGQGQGNVLLDDVDCTGRESFLWDCNNRGWNQANCGHGEDVGVDCFSSTSNFKLAFHAEVTSSYTISSIRANQTLAFRHIVYNEGGQYSSSGQFTCTLTGTYVFHLGLKPSGSVPLKAYIINSSTNQKLALVDTSDGHGSTRFASNVAIFKLTSGQRVSVQVDSTQASGARLDNEMSYFSGFFLHPN